MGCYPFVEHPEGLGCDAQVYGTICLPGGVGTQGAICGDDTGDICAPGFVCVVGQRAGKRCAALCDPGGEDTCTGGLICGDLDVAAAHRAPVRDVQALAAVHVADLVSSARQRLAHGRDGGFLSGAFAACQQTLAACWNQRSAQNARPSENCRFDCSVFHGLA